ncbi:DUF6362 family protein [Pseudaminobacter sp. NGMCC 1.201702]|uniref:DUF6362 family protein n=1 Tax=Pseudaminobacter sp. NGMCC 1.201702 TaxID=3391825 RepID=UPI0039F0AE22
MNIGEIAERIVMAVEIEEASHAYRVGPNPARSLQLPYEHSWADRNGWGKTRHEEETAALWKAILNRPTPQQITEAEEALSWLRLVSHEDERTALAAWARCMADSKRQFFKDWCFDNGIHPETGRRRKDRALARIHAQLNRSDVQNCETTGLGELPDDREIEDIDATFPKSQPKGNPSYTWRDDDAFQPIVFARREGTREIETLADDFSWAAKRNERRRQREARKRQREAA